MLSDLGSLVFLSCVLSQSAFLFDLRSHHLAFPLFGLAQELGDSAGGCQVRRSGLIEALGHSIMGQGRRPTLKSAAHYAACVPRLITSADMKAEEVDQATPVTLTPVSAWRHGAKYTLQ